MINTIINRIGVMIVRKFKGTIGTDNVGSECEFEFEIEDYATNKDIENAAKEVAFEYIYWNYDEVKD